MTQDPDHANAEPHLTRVMDTSDSPAHTAKTRARKWSAWRKWIVTVVAVAVALAIFTIFDVRGLLHEALRTVDRLAPWRPVLFVGIYVLATVFFVPGSALTLGAGALFGVVWGLVYVSLGSTLGATSG